MSGVSGRRPSVEGIGIVRRRQRNRAVSGALQRQRRRTLDSGARGVDSVQRGTQRSLAGLFALGALEAEGRAAIVRFSGLLTAAGLPGAAARHGLCRRSRQQLLHQGEYENGHHRPCRQEARQFADTAMQRTNHRCRKYISGGKNWVSSA